MPATDDRSNLLRTQAVHACLEALGAAHVRVNGNDWPAGGVVLNSAAEMTSTTHWREASGMVAYDVTVTVDVTRRQVE